MIGCIQIGTTTIQGEVTDTGERAVRFAPEWDLRIEKTATIDGRTGALVVPYRQRCDECRQMHGKHLDWCPQGD